jgi:hypothetical protein
MVYNAADANKTTNQFLLRKGLLAPEKGAHVVILSEAKDLLPKASQQVEEILRFAQDDKSGGFFVAEGLQNPFPQQELINNG